MALNNDYEFFSEMSFPVENRLSCYMNEFFLRNRKIVEITYTKQVLTRYQWWQWLWQRHTQRQTQRQKKIPSFPPFALPVDLLTMTVAPSPPWVQMLCCKTLISLAALESTILQMERLINPWKTRLARPPTWTRVEFFLQMRRTLF